MTILKGMQEPNTFENCGFCDIVGVRNYDTELRFISNYWARNFKFIMSITLET